MKSLVAIVILVNCLAFFMLSHIQRQSELLNIKANGERALVLESPLKLKLTSEPVVEPLVKIDRPAPVRAYPAGDNELIVNLCELFGPFDNKPLAEAALIELLEEEAQEKMIIYEQKSAQYWLKIPLVVSRNIANGLSSQYDNKKRYKEVCMKVAYTQKFQ